MVLYIGNEPIAGYSTNTKMNAHSLLDFKWSDHILNELSWVNADTFSWLSGDVYTAVYNHLVNDSNGAPILSDTINGITIYYWLANDGHKIVGTAGGDVYEQNIIDVYNQTGVAWYYLLDPTNRRFKLPRTKYNRYMSQVAVKGNGIALGLTDGVNNMSLGSADSVANSPRTCSQYGATVGTLATSYTGSDDKTLGITTDASKSGMVADLSTDTNMLLYFYVGEFAQSAIEQTAGYAQTLTEKKADVDLANVLANIDFVVESKMPTEADPTWYRVYKSGWVEQGGSLSNNSGGAKDIVFLKPFSNNNYYLSCSSTYSSNGSTDHQESMNEFVSRSTTGFRKYLWGTTNKLWWEAKGQGAN